MGKLKLSTILLIGLVSMGVKCKDSGDIRHYSLDVDNRVLRSEEAPIYFDDPRLRCLDLPDGRECRFICIEADDLEEILPPVTFLD